MDIVTLFVFISIRVGLFFVFSAYLFNKWFHRTDRFYSDIPFLMGLNFLLTGIGKIFDAAFLYIIYSNYGIYGELPHEHEMALLPVFKLRWILLIASVIPYLYVTLKILIAKKPRAVTVFTGCYAIFWSLMISFAPDYDTTKNFLPFVVIPIALFLGIAFLLIYKRRSLSEVNCLLLGIGFVLLVITSILRPIITEQYESILEGFFIPEILDLMVWAVIFASFLVKPFYISKNENWSVNSLDEDSFGSESEIDQGSVIGGDNSLEMARRVKKTV